MHNRKNRLLEIVFPISKQSSCNKTKIKDLPLHRVSSAHVPIPSATSAVNKSTATAKYRLKTCTVKHPIRPRRWSIKGWARCSSHFRHSGVRDEAARRSRYRAGRTSADGASCCGRSATETNDCRSPIINAATREVMLVFPAPFDRAL